MPSLPILDVAIGLGVIYAVLALACTAINEIAAQFFNWRAKTLVKGIRQLVNDPAISDRLLSHPLITALGEGDKSFPSYLSGNTFALALLDSLTRRKANADMLDIHDALKNIDNSGLGRTLSLLAASAANKAGYSESITKSTELNHLVGEITIWYDNATDRFSGWYKRKVQVFTLVVAAVFCIALNADTVNIAHALVNNASLRVGLIAYAEGYTKANPPAQPGVQPVAQSERPATTLASSEQAQSDPSKIIAANIKSIDQAVTQLDNAGIPLGWKECPNSAGAWMSKLLGLLITILAVSMGAPFWFDLLSRFVNIRAAGIAPKKAAMDYRHEDQSHNLRMNYYRET